MRSPNCELDDYDVLRDIDVELVLTQSGGHP